MPRAGRPAPLLGRWRRLRNCAMLPSMIAYIPLLFAVVGVLMYALATNPKIQEIGRIMFACGWLVTMFVLSGHTLRILAG